MSVTLIGDVHGLAQRYLDIAANCEYSVQLGDMGFSYDHMERLNPNNHKFLGGNHDNYDALYGCPHSLGKYGQFELGGQHFFFIRGAWSIDGDYRRIKRKPKTWWQEEELDWKNLEDALKLYRKVRPSIMLSHEAPLLMIKHLTDSKITKSFGYDYSVIETRTNIWLQKCLDAWRPQLWVFGHYHKSWNVTFGLTEFRCLNELETLVI